MYISWIEYNSAPLNFYLPWNANASKLFLESMILAQNVGYSLIKKDRPFLYIFNVMRTLRFASFLVNMVIWWDTVDIFDDLEL